MSPWLRNLNPTVDCALIAGPNENGAVAGWWLIADLVGLACQSC